MAKNPPLRANSIEVKRTALESEYQEPLRDIVTGFIPLGTTRRETAESLGVGLHSLTKFCAAEDIRFPGVNERRRTRRHFSTEDEHARRRAISTTMRRNSKRKYTRNGRTQSLSDWADQAGIPESTLRSRIKRGMNMDKALDWKNPI